MKRPEPLVKPHEYARAVNMTRANHKRDKLDEAEEALRLVRLKEPIWQANIDAAFGEMAEARADLRNHLSSPRGPRAAEKAAGQKS